MSGVAPRVLERGRLWLLLVSLCPALAVANRLDHALLLGAVMLLAVLGTGLAGAGLERLPAVWLRLPLRLLLASALVTACERLLRIAVPGSAGGLGIYLPLLAVNGLLLASTGRGSWGESVREAAGRGAAYAGALALLALIREALGAGTITLFPAGSFSGVWELPGLLPAEVLAAAPGALLLLGYAAALARRLGRSRS